jgi:hypothetical protein
VAGTTNFFGRAYRLTLEGPGFGKKVFETQKDKPAMDIKFDVKFARSQVAMEGTVSILGLGWKTINEIMQTSVIARGDYLKNQLHVKLEAGYFTNVGMVEIIDGYVFYASVTAPPEMWLTMKVTEYNQLGAKMVQFDKEIEPMPIKPYVGTILDKIAKAEQVQIRLVDKTEEKILESKKKVHVSLKGEDWCLRTMIMHLTNNLSDEAMFILRTYCASNRERIVEVHSKKMEGGIGEPIMVDADHGLLSVSGLTATGGTVTTFLDGRCDNQLSHIILKSELNPQANGKYLITEKHNVGHYAGKEWYTKYTCEARNQQ